MGHRNTQFTGHMSDTETDQQGHSNMNPEPCIFYRSLPNFPQPNIHSVVPPPVNQCNFNFHHLPEHHDNGFFYGMPQLNRVQPHPITTLDLAVTAPSAHYNPYLAAPSGIRDFPVQVNHGTHDQLSLASARRIVGIPTDSYGRCLPYMDGIRGLFKRKNAEGAPGNFQYHNSSAGSSSSVAPVTAMAAESDITLMDAGSFLPPEYGGNDPTSMFENGSHRSMRNRPVIVGHESVLSHNASHLMQGNYVSNPVQLPGNPWLDMHFSANNGDMGTFGWTHAPLPYVHASLNGACVDGNIPIQGYQVTTSNRSSSNLLHPSLPQGHSNPHHPPPPMQATRGYNVNNPPSQVATSSRRIPTISSSNTYQDVVDAGPTFLASFPPMGYRFYRPQPRDIILDSSARHHTLPHLRVLPEDEVAVLEIPGYHEPGDSIDQHRDMRLDIDHMSYEELLALEEQIGTVGIGLSEEFIRNNLKTRTFTSSAFGLNLEEPACLDQQINFCVICQSDYEDGQDIMGTLDCGHEYHKDCIKKWLLMKNTCPVCKSTALSRKPKDS